MKGYTIQNSIDLLEKAVEKGGGSGGASTTADVSYDNTSSHLTADDVQEAIDELVSEIADIPDNGVYSTTETKVGTWKGEDLFRKVIEIEGPLSTTGTSNTIAFNMPDYISDFDQIFGVCDKSFVSGVSGDTPFVRGFTGLTIEDEYLVAYSPAARTNVSATLTVEYTKAAAQSTRKKKK